MNDETELMAVSVTGPSQVLKGAPCPVRLPVTNRAALPSRLGGCPEIPARYCIVRADELRPSHTLGGDLRHEAIHNRRAYHTNAAGVYAESMFERAKMGALLPEHVLDTTAFVIIGPPLVTPDLRVVAGTQRALFIQGAAQLANDAYTSYRQMLLDRARAFGFRSVAKVAAFDRPALVRVIDAEFADDEDLLARLNELSDRSITKPKDPLTLAATLGDYLRSSPRAREIVLEHFREAERTRGNYSTATVRFFVRTQRAYDLFSCLLEEGAMEEHDRLVFEDARSEVLSELGRFLMARVITAAALGDGLALDDVDRRIQDWLGPSIPVLIEEPGDAPWSELKRDLCGALRLMRGFGGEDLFERERSQRRYQQSLLDFVDGQQREGGRAHHLARIVIQLPPNELRARFERWGGGGQRSATQVDIFDSFAAGVETAELPKDYGARFEEVFGKVESPRPFSAEATRQDLKALRRKGAKFARRELERLVPVSRWRKAETIMASMYPRSKRRGGLNDRGIAAGIVFLKRQGVPWRLLLSFWDDLPPSWQCGTFQTVRHRFRVWRNEELELFSELCRVLGIADPPEPTRGGPAASRRGRRERRGRNSGSDA